MKPTWVTNYIQYLPFVLYKNQMDPTPRIGAFLGDHILCLKFLSGYGYFKDELGDTAFLMNESLDDLKNQGKDMHAKIRKIIWGLMQDGSKLQGQLDNEAAAETRKHSFVSRADAEVLDRL